MSSRATIPAVGPTEPASSASRWAKVASLIEVLLAFVFVHVAFRAIKHFTELGRAEGAARLNFTPGVVMIFFTVCVLLLCGRSFATYGLTLEHWGENLKVGLLWGMLLVTGAGLLRLAGVQHLPGATPPTMTEGVIYGLAALGAVIGFAWMLSRQRTVLGRIPTALCVAVFLVVLVLPLVLALYYGRPFGHTLLTVLWLAVGAGCGEELLYRGYIQSRVNESFGRPFRVLGIQFGMGLLVSSLLFGFLHALNSVDYFQGRFTFAWGFGIANIFTGLLYGCLRETTGGILAPVVTHATLDVLVIIPGLIAGP
jgi:membrane protease YdiL (CAAX protease family)